MLSQVEDGDARSPRRVQSRPDPALDDLVGGWDPVCSLPRAVGIGADGVRAVRLRWPLSVMVAPLRSQLAACECSLVGVNPDLPYLAASPCSARSTLRPWSYRRLQGS